MMMEAWNDISYMVELLAACMIFIIPMRREKGFWVRSGIMGILLLALAYIENSQWGIPPVGILHFAYWAAYLIASGVFIWVCMGQGPLRAAYCAIFACAVQHIAYDLYLIYAMLGGKSNVITVLIYIIVYAAAYVFVARKLPEGDGVVVSKKSLFPMATIIMLVLVLSIMDDSFIAGFEAGSLHRVIYRIIDALCCFYVLWVQISQKELMKLQNELSGINAAWRLQKEQYEMTGDTIENINRKCHDLKHQIRALRNMADGQEREEYLDELENDIMIYDTALQTGNRALDIVLMEKALFCKNHGINWTCMADGARLDFMKVEDIYAIFGNALDNAIRAVMELEDAMKRVISVKIVIQNSILMIQIQNYYKGSLHFENGLPLTTKKNKRDHGYGMKSIQHTAEKYNGTITVNTENAIFMLQILIPVAEAKSA